MSQPDREETERILPTHGDDVVEAWEERPEVIEAGLDDTTASGYPGTTERGAAADRHDGSDVEGTRGA